MTDDEIYQALCKVRRHMTERTHAERYDHPLNEALNIIKELVSELETRQAEQLIATTSRR